MQGNITIYTSNQRFEESKQLRASLTEIGFSYEEHDVSSKPGKSSPSTAVVLRSKT
jgi:hypothetical protein